MSIEEIKLYCRNGDLEKLKKININEKWKYINTEITRDNPLPTACEYGNLEICKWIYKNYFYFYSDGMPEWPY